MKTIALLGTLGLLVVGCAGRPAGSTTGERLALDPATSTQFADLFGSQLTKLCTTVPEVQLDRLALYGKACAADDAESCLKSAVIYTCGKGVAKNDAIAMSLYDKACNLREDGACQLKGAALIAGTMGKRDVAAGLALFDASCARGSGPACGSLGSALAMSENPAMKKEGVARIERGCALKNDDACANLAIAQLVGTAGKPDVPKAVATAKAACERKNAEACGVLGSMALQGVGMPKDPAAAVKLYEMSCDGGQAKSCLYLASCAQHGVGMRVDTDRAVALVKKACDGGSGEACRFLAEAGASPALTSAPTTETMF